MTNWKRSAKNNLAIKQLIKYFFQGLVVIVPLGISIYAVLWMFNAVDSIVPNIIRTFNPNWQKETPEQLHIPGVGFVLVIVIVILIG